MVGMGVERRFWRGMSSETGREARQQLGVGGGVRVGWGGGMQNHSQRERVVVGRTGGGDAELQPEREKGGGRSGGGGCW